MFIYNYEKYVRKLASDLESIPTCKDISIRISIHRVRDKTRLWHYSVAAGGCDVTHDVELVSLSVINLCIYRGTNFCENSNLNTKICRVSGTFKNCIIINTI